METKQFKAESKRLLDLMINSIYTHREIFLRELISNASDAIDKIYYKALVDENINFDKDNYFIKVTLDKDSRTIKISDTGIGMTKEELDDNLGVIAKSGSLKFKKENEIKDGYDIIGQFGVGFYSSFLIADKVTVISKAYGSNEAYKWESCGVDGYTIEPCYKDSIGTDIILHVKENSEDENFYEYLEEYKIRTLIKKYSDFIRYPIKMDITERRLKEGSENEYEDIIEEKVVNSMVPIWRKNKNELTTEDYDNFYKEKHYGFDKPLKHIHLSVDGTVSYNAILYIPENMPYDFYTKDYEKGLELYSNGVMIMNKCSDLLPDYFGFVKGIVDSEDLSLNISREMLQHDRQLKVIADRIEKKIQSELTNMLKKDRETYEKFFKNFGLQLKFGIYQSYGMLKDKLQDLLLFYSGKEEKMITLKEYVENMKEGQTEIYFASGETKEKISHLPQVEAVRDRDFDVLYMMDNVDEFMIQMMRDYDSKAFKNVAQGDLNLDSEEEKKELEKINEDNKSLLESLKEALKDKVVDVKVSNRLKSHPVCLVSDQGVSFEMEKVLNAMPDGQDVKAGRILEINPNHDIFKAIQNVYQNNADKINDYASLLFDQALLIEGLSIEDPVAFSNKICELMIELNK